MSDIRLYLGCFEWVINLIYSTLFTYIPLPKFNQWDSLVPLISRKGMRCQVDVKRIVSREHIRFPWRYCIIARKPASFANGMVETTME